MFIVFFSFYEKMGFMIDGIEKVVYIMGHPYSGSTLLSAALGNDLNVFNLSEVCFLEKDFKCNTRCSCGKK